MDKVDKNEIAVIGDKDSIMGFKSIGFDTYEIIKNNESDIKQVVISILRKNYKIIYIIEEYFLICEKELDEFMRNKTYPIITVIPSTSGSKNITFDNIKKLIEKALGGSFI